MNRFIFYFHIFALIVLANSKLFAATMTPDEGRVIYVPASQLIKLNGFAIDRFSLMAIKDGKLQVIPSQIDELTDEGYVYFKDGSYKNSGKEGAFDANDVLMFMLKDAGAKKGNQKINEGHVMAEIEVEHFDGKKSYVYVIKDSIITSEEIYVRNSVETGRLESDYYFLKVKPDNAFIWEELYIESYDGKNKHYPFDTMKLRFGSSVAFVGPRLNFSNNSIVAKPVADKTGAIRSITQYKLQVKIAGIPFLSFDLQMFVSQQHVRYLALMKIPMVRRTLISRPAVFITLDGRELDGTQIRFASDSSLVSLVDGKVDQTEEAIMNTEMSADKNWVMLSTGHNLDGLALLNFSEFGKSPVIPFIQDDPEAENQPEFFPGQSPNVGFQLQGMPLKGVQVIDVTLHLFPDEVTSNLDKFVEQYKKSPQLSVKYF